MSNIRNKLDNMPYPVSSDDPLEYCHSALNDVSVSSFAHVSVDEVRSTIVAMAPKLCELDSIPLRLFKGNIDCVSH